MTAANGKPRARAAVLLLAGLQAGLLAVLSMLCWLGLSAKWHRQSFWTAANLMASTFYGSPAIHAGFSLSTVSGLALYVMLYAALGAVFALAVHARARGLTLVLAGVAFGLSWYFLSFGVLWKKLSPLVALLHPERPTMAGHLLYGALVARFPRYLTRGALPQRERAGSAL
jgi:hypothetical protein